MDETVTLPAAKSGQTVFVLLDPADAQMVGTRKLSVGSHGYAQICPPGVGKVVLLHRVILGLQRGDRRIGDHINGNRLDNRRANLRIVNASGSSQNVAGRGRSKFRGVLLARSGLWYAQVKFHNVTYRLGTYATELDAAVAAHLKRCELMPSYVLRPDLASALVSAGRDLSRPVPIQKRRHPSDVVTQYIRLMNDGKTRQEIAKEIGLTVSGLAGALLRARHAGDLRTARIKTTDVATKK